mgnify:FL=1
MKRKGIIFITILFLVTCMLSLFTTVKAATGSMYLNIKLLRNSGYGYKLASNNKNVWKIYETDGNGNDKGLNSTIYCLKGGPGFGSSDYVSGTPQETHYTQYFNLKDPNSITPNQYKNVLPDTSSKEYKALLWILDNCYVAPKTNPTTEEANRAVQDKKNLLNAAAAYAEEVSNTDVTINELNLLTDDDIDAVQQIAVWYYTNPEGDPYHVTSIDFWLNSVQGTENSTFKSMINFGDDGWDRANACQALFDYLVQTPQKADFTYTIDNSNVTPNPIKIADTDAKIVKNGDNYIVGPFRLQRQGNINYSFDAKFLDQNNTVISSITLLDSNKDQTNKSIKNLVGEDFYISVPTSANIESIKLEISGSYTTTKSTYWSVENPDSAKDQPVVKVEKSKIDFNDSKTVIKEEEKYFDLALRKFIISINGQAPSIDRTPQIDATELAKLISGTTTTANKVHPKDPLTVTTGDKVIYKIRVYNEGELDGYVTELTDYLPSGLELVPNTESTINQTYGWTNPSGDGKTIKTAYLADKLIEAFNGTELKYVDVEVECKVVAPTQSTDQRLKNIAEITAHKDKDGNETVIDRDSQPNNVNKDNYGTTSQEDDDDFEDLIMFGKYFDLALRKFITAVNNKEITNREPQVVLDALKDGSSTTATYNHPKTPVNVYNGDIVTYTIRVYNEGQLDGYVTEITDHLPQQLEFIVDDELNAKYGWILSEDGRTVKTNITSSTTSSFASRDQIYEDRTNNTDKVLLKAFDGNVLDYIDVKIKCKVKDNISLYEKITNIADITDFTDKNGNAIIDRDSQKSNVVLPTDETLPEYKDTEIERGDTYIAGQQDDDDFEKLILKKFDLALRKFITGVNEKEITNRAPVFTKTSDGKYEYVHPKDPVDVANGNTVIYTLRIFNEGNVAGYAEEVKDNLPEGLEFLPENTINTAFKWKMYKEDGTETTDVKEAKFIKTNYLSKANETVEGNNILKAFDPETMTMPDYKDIKIAFKVTEPNTSDRIIINTAEIADDADEDGNEVDDVDSTPDNNVPEEDDQDIEKIKVKYFDLALKKWVTESIVTYNGKTTVTKTGHTGDENPEPPAKVEIRQDRINKTTVKFKFSIKVTNEGEIEGYAKEIIDYIPEGLKFVAEDNPKWRLTDDGKVLTDQLKDVLIKPGESQTVEIILTWINGKSNMGLKTNWAEIYEDYNEHNSPDIDSTPGNNKKGEDDIDEAPVILTTATGNAPTYATLALASISMIAGGIVLIKKYVI